MQQDCSTAREHWYSDYNYFIASKSAFSVIVFLAPSYCQQTASLTMSSSDNQRCSQHPFQQVCCDKSSTINDLSTIISTCLQN